MKYVKLLLALILFSCRKESISKPIVKCPSIDQSFYGSWSWVKMKPQNGQWIYLNLGAMQNISISENQIQYPNANGFSVGYTNLGCRMFNGICDYQNVQVFIDSDTMTIIGLSDQTEWKLCKL